MSDKDQEPLNKFSQLNYMYLMSAGKKLAPRSGGLRFKRSL
jgi:hypothetical protein